jgi:hypothetical protein
MFKTMMLSVFVVGACVADVEGEEGPETSVDPRLAANGLTPAQLLNTTLIPGVLDQANLDEMASTADGRVTLRYVFGCALAQGTSVTANYLDDAGNPQTQAYGGAFGIASNWTTAPLTVAQQRLVTSCTAALSNANGSNVMLSLRGPGSIWTTTSQELSQYQLQEGAFFGNMFAGGEGIAACKGSGNSASSGRVCAKPDASGSVTQCGYAYAGTCATKCTLSSGYFINCTWNGSGYTSPVSTYLSN